MPRRAPHCSGHHAPRAAHRTAPHRTAPHRTAQTHMNMLAGIHSCMHACTRTVGTARMADQRCDESADGATATGGEPYTVARLHRLPEQACPPARSHLRANALKCALGCGRLSGELPKVWPSPAEDNPTGITQLHLYVLHSAHVLRALSLACTMDAHRCTQVQQPVCRRAAGRAVCAERP